MRLNYCDAIHKAFYDALRSDENVVFFGEDDKYNLYGYTEGLYNTFGAKRVRDIPLSEAGALGIACGAAMCGLRPILDLTTENFLYVAMDQICSIAAKVPYMNNGKSRIPITIFCSAMNIGGNAAQHSDRLHSLFSNVPGLKIICPATPQDMYSLLRAAIEDDNPVICFADRSLFWRIEEVDLAKNVEIGKAKVVNEGTDLTLISISGCYKYCEELLKEYSDRLSIEWIDVRSVVPLDLDTISNSVRKTGRVVVCDTAGRTGSLAGNIASFLAQESFEFLKAPIGIATAEDVPVPYAKGLEGEVLVSIEKIRNEIERVIRFRNTK